MNRLSFRLTGPVFGLLAALLAAPAVAQTYPEHVIRLIVPFPPGGGNDTLGRLVAQRLSTRLGQQVRP